MGDKKDDEFQIETNINCNQFERTLDHIANKCVEKFGKECRGLIIELPIVEPKEPTVPVAILLYHPIKLVLWEYRY